MSKQLLVAVVLALFGAGCDKLPARNRIADILRNPADYSGRTVTVQGEVSSAVKLPLLPGLYWVRDETGEIAVLPQHDPPLSPRKVWLRGRWTTWRP